MNRGRKLLVWPLIFCAMFAITFSHALLKAQTNPGSASSEGAKAGSVAPATTQSGAAPATTNTSSSASSAQEIAAAKASGKVWVNTETKVYHKSGRWYGKTKRGKFMTESEAKAAGYKEAKR